MDIGETLFLELHVGSHAFLYASDMISIYMNSFTFTR